MLVNQNRQISPQTCRRKSDHTKSLQKHGVLDEMAMFGYTNPHPCEIKENIIDVIGYAAKRLQGAKNRSE
jgi:hypothetical protein